MTRLALIFLLGAGGFSLVGCSGSDTNLADTVTESDIEEYERMLKESEESSNEE